MKALLLFSLIALVVIDAVADALKDKTGKRNHWFEAGLIAVVFTIVGLNYYEQIHWINLVLSYVGWRISLFNIFYNGIRGLPWDFIGTTSKIDRLLRKVPNIITVSLFILCLFGAIVAFYYPFF